ncbi:hypothetical protein Tco_0431449 [Tanacetum coccineum]
MLIERGFPVWLKYVPRVSFRTDKEPFQKMRFHAPSELLDRRGDVIEEEFDRQGIDFAELIAMIMRTAWRKGDITLKYWASIIVILISYKVSDFDADNVCTLQVISSNSQEKLCEAMKSTELPEDIDHSQIANHLANSSLLKRLTDISQKYYEAALDNRVLKADVETMRALSTSIVPLSNKDVGNISGSGVTHGIGAIASRGVMGIQIPFLFNYNGT